jgi:signal transduction histidine kinase
MIQRNGKRNRKRALAKRKPVEPHSARSANGSLAARLHGRSPRNSSTVQAFETLVMASEIFGLVVDSAGIVRTVRIPDSERLKPACSVLIGRSLPDILGKKTYQIFAESFHRSARASQAEELGCLIDLLSGRRWFSVVIRCVSARRGHPKLFSIFVRDVTGWRQAQQRLEKAKTLLTHAERTARMCTWEIDLRTGELTFSRDLFDVLGITKRKSSAVVDLLWKVVHSCYSREGAGRSEAPTSRAADHEVPYLHPDGTNRTLQTRVIPVPCDEQPPLRFVGMIRDVTEQKSAERELRESDVLHRLSQELMRARDEERRQMARELHESAGQSLAALKMTLGNLREALPRRNSAAYSHLQTCVDLTNEAVREVRTISYLMHPPMLDEAGLASALRWYAKGFSERSRIHVDVDVSDDFGRQPQEIEMTLFRIIQEALTNIHRYSGSKVARIRLTRDSGAVRAEIQDEGCGLIHRLQSSGSDQLPGVGIAGMRERAHQLNGTFEIDSVRGSGTTVRVILPLLAVRSAPLEVISENTDAETRDASLRFVSLTLSQYPQGGSRQ